MQFPLGQYQFSGAKERDLGLALAVLSLAACSSAADAGGLERRDAQPVVAVASYDEIPMAGAQAQPTHVGSGSQFTGSPVVAAPEGSAMQRPSGECGAVTEMAENKLQPLDIIFGIDTSGSMAEEVLQVQANLNAFSQQIVDSGIDVQVIMLASLQGTGNGVVVDGPCITAPLGSGQCPNDSNPPAYIHINQPVTSWDVLDVFVNAYPAYKPHLRVNSLKTFVAISDDNADSTTHPLGFVGIQPVIHSADGFIAAVDALEPGALMWSDWRYSSIYSFSLCPSAQLGAIGTIHAELVERTGGVAGDLCLQEFKPVFDELARVVSESIALSCNWDIPPPPSGEAFDPKRSNVALTLDRAAEELLKIPAGADCGSLDGWRYDDESNPTKVEACPATCQRIQAASDARVDLLFGCETKVLPLQ